MSDINKSESVTIKYEDGKIKVIGQKVKAVLEVSSGELKNMYFGRTGRGTLHVQITED